MRLVLFGIVNVTEDSFSDGGRYLMPDAAIAHARMLAGGALVAIVALSLASWAAAANALPERVGDCARTHISRVTHRLEDGITHKAVTDSGSAVEFANRLSQVSYEELPEVSRSRTGDPVLICLVHIPQHCPKGDNRGNVYTTTNLRTLESWTLPDAEHVCGGA